MARKKRHPTYLPRSLKVRKKEYTVEPRSESWMNKNKAYGMAFFGDHTLKIGITSAKLENISTLAHEFGHAYINEYRIKASTERTEEDLVKLFEKMFIVLYTQLD